MTTWLSVITAMLALAFMVFTAIVGLLIRIVVKWVRTESKVNELAEDMHSMAATMDRRMRFVEEHLMSERKR